MISTASNKAAEGFTLWLTGLSGAGKTTLAQKLAQHFTQAKLAFELLDGDTVRAALGDDLGFSKADRHQQAKRLAWVAQTLNRHGIAVIIAAIAPYQAHRDEARATLGSHFIEVYCDAPLAVVCDRDVKGLYAKAKAGEIQGMTGIDAPYQPPTQPEVHLKTDSLDPAQCVLEVLQTLQKRGHLSAANAHTHP